MRQINIVLAVIGIVAVTFFVFLFWTAESGAATVSNRYSTTSMPVDSLRRSIPVASTIVLQDASVPPQVSPKTNLGQTASAFVTPADAVAFIFQTEATARVGTDSALTTTADGKGWYEVPANVQFTLPCGGGWTYYIRTDSAATTTIKFLYEILEVQQWQRYP